MANNPEGAINTYDDGGFAVCMGATACRRICVANGVSTLMPAMGDHVLPGEFNCATLDEDAATPVKISASHLEELDKATLLPSLEFLGDEVSAAEAKAYLEHLDEGHKKFENYLLAILRSARLPRGSIDEAAAALGEHRFESPNVSLFDRTEDEKAQLSLFYAQLRGFHDRKTLRRDGILFDRSAQEVLVKAAEDLSVGHHISLSGEPGMAKSTLAKYLGTLNSIAHNPGRKKAAAKPTLIELSSTSEAESQITEQTFEDDTLGSKMGPMAEAMAEGRVIILDEINGMTADQQIFFNDILLRPVGDTVRVGDKKVTIKPGFAVIATLNPMTDTQGARRHGRQQQDSAGAARYSRHDLKYPGQKGYQGEAKETLTRLFMASWAEHYGWQAPTNGVLVALDNTQEFLTKLTRMATEPPQDGTSAEGLLGGAQARPQLAECITPRDFTRILEKTMTHASALGLPASLRAAITEKTRQIINSDNGHQVAPTAVAAVDQLLEDNKFAKAS